ncbi:MazG nucleotide pyrophosphohydrolase domain-containing protein [Thermococcus thioreducens]|uniref:NTP pyrophosphatase, house-cleaning of non-canonical NTPs n=1 Tax=Thermococcus thioreducens TaxID=277988 RepID=A0A0Q2XP20_9EURY|nr:MazG nucleotide pyrophosphohydrolase domain-containing protein [Thermococcus thioreducens]ASJ12294.1 hypothetical protein A3L14_05050 [Thermococcus thioreducens]KQH83028.1 hypothetical protein AMR53_02045 [Thermococcus thioreducens]SEV93374.1 NTP pyrophosphatase, house-cleaning of non-canonical NTPs [Thermococcus thioreducens]
MNELQRRVDELITEFGGYWEPFQMLAAFVEEVGELADELLKAEGIKGEGKWSKLEEELGDVMFALACIANYYKIDLLDALGKSIEKYRERDRKRWPSSR